MKTIEPHINHSMVSPGRWLLRALQSSVIGTVLIVAIPGAAQEMNLKSLNRLVGTWRVFDPSGEGGVDGHVTYEWMEGGFFLMQRFDFQHNGQKIRGIEIIGYEHAFGAEPGKEIKSRVYDIMGNTLDYVYEVDNDTLTIWGGQKGSPAYFKGYFSDDGNTCTGGWVYPGGGGYKSTMTRVKK